MESLREYGDHFIVGVSGSSLTSDEAEALKALGPLGVILFGKNFAKEDSHWLSTHRTLIADLHSACGRDDLLLSIDHEGGRVHRFPESSPLSSSDAEGSAGGPVTRFPAAITWGDSVEAVGAAMAAELRAMGFNQSYSPVLDVWSEPLNRVIGDRSFGDDPSMVGQLGSRYLTALERGGVVGCIKHFPGHGATIADSHEELPRLEADKELLLRREVAPFAIAIEAGAELLMTAHVQYPALDPKYPATLSKSILEELLRGALGFKGAVISDDLEMRALSYLTHAEKAVLAFNAGVEILLEANPKHGSAPEIALEMARGLRDAVKGGSITAKRMTAAQERMRRFKSHAAKVVNQVTACSPHDVVGCASHRELAGKIAAAAKSRQPVSA